ncbi:hypothetical protein BJX70DRAFT_410892 [Aspergillus crustosus]
MTDTRVTSYGSDIELAYASPVVVELKGADRQLEADGRKRRHRGSSSDSGNAAWDNFVNEDLRVGGPFMSPLPAKVKPISRTHYLNEVFHGRDSTVLSQVGAILVSHNIAFQSIRVVEKTAVFYPDRVTLTLSVIARRTGEDESWLRASRAIRTFLCQRGLTSVVVEIADPQAFEDTRLSPVERSERVYSVWDSLRDEILATIRLSGVRVVGCFRAGKSHNPADNPPTVLIIVDYRSLRDFKEERELVIGILTRRNLGQVAVSIVKDLVSRHVVRPVDNLNLDVFKGPAKVGQSLGPGNQNRLSGTFGAFIQLKHHERETWHTYGLTCYHCVVPPEGAQEHLERRVREKLQTWAKHGITMHAECADALVIDHPTLQDIEAKVEDLQATTQRLSSDLGFRQSAEQETEGLLEMMPRADRCSYLQNKQEIAQCKTLIETIETWRRNESQYLGYVAAGSGFRTRPAETMKPGTKHSILDWALVKVREERQAPNRVGKCSLERELCLYGRSSGHSIGQYNSLKPALIVEQIVDEELKQVETREHTILGTMGEPFSLPGDSGGVVHTRQGVMVGMVVAGCTAKDLSFFTHIEDLFPDIMRSTKARKIRLPPGSGD